MSLNGVAISQQVTEYHNPDITYIFIYFKYDSFTMAEVMKMNVEAEAFKAQLREDHTFGLLHREVLGGLRSRNERRSGPLNLLLPEEGSTLGFEGTPFTQHFGYAEGKLSLGTLVAQLGPRWDVLVRSEVAVAMLPQWHSNWAWTGCCNICNVP